MPKALSAIIPIIAAAIVAFVPGAQPFAAAILFGAGAVSFGLQSIVAADMRRQARRQFNAAQTDRLANVVSQIEPRKLVMGRVRVGGSVFYKASTGEFQRDLYILLAIAGHEIDAVEAVYLNDQLVSVDGSGLVQTAPYKFSRRLTERVLAGGPYLPTLVPGSIYTEILSGGDAQDVVTGYEIYQRDTSESAVKLTIHLGTPGQTVDPDIAAAFPSEFSASDRVTSVAYIVAKLQYSETAFPSGIPALTAVVRGAKIHDPRTGLTAWSENPAIMARHVYMHPNFGNTVPTAAEDARFIVAANACDLSTVYKVAGVNQPARALYKAAIVAPFGAPTTSLLDDLAQAMAGVWAYAGGALHIKAGVYTAPVKALGESDLSVVQTSAGQTQQSPIVITPHVERVKKFNVVKAKIWDGGQDFKLVDMPPLVASALVTRDGEELVQEISIPSVNYAPQALHISGIAIRDARDSLTITGQFKLTAYMLEPFDVVTLTIARYGWAAKEFIVMAREWSVDGSISLTLKETSALITQLDADFQAAGFASNSNLPRPWDIARLGALTISSGTSELAKQSDGTVVSRMRVAWAQSNDFAVKENGQIEVQYRLSDSQGAWTSVVVPGNETNVVIPDVTDNQYYVVRARQRTSVAVSDWNVQIQHKVIGKTEPPPPFDKFLILAQPDGTRQYNFQYETTPTPDDWLGAEIRFTPGAVSNPDWSLMQALQDGTTYYTASPIEINAPLSGTWTFSCRSRDTTGNLSTALHQTITLGKRRTGNTVDEFFEEIYGWPGTVNGFRRTDGVLEATDTTTTWATLPATWSAWTRWVMAPTSPAVYTTLAVDLGLELAGQIAADIVADGIALLEIRTGNDGISWSAWGSSSGTFKARWVQLRLTVTASIGAPVPRVTKFDWSVVAELITKNINDVVISALTGPQRIGVGDVRAPIGNVYTFIKRSNVTVQDSSAGQWSSQRIDNSLTGPRWQFKLNGVLADPAFVDFYIEGF